MKWNDANNLSLIIFLLYNNLVNKFLLLNYLIYYFFLENKGIH